MRISKNQCRFAVFAYLILRCCGTSSQGGFEYYDLFFFSSYGSTTVSAQGSIMFDDQFPRMLIGGSYEGFSSEVWRAQLHAPTLEPYMGSAMEATVFPSLPGLIRTESGSGHFGGDYMMVFPDNYDPQYWRDYRRFYPSDLGNLSPYQSLRYAASQGLAYFEISSLRGETIRAYLTKPIPEPSAVILMAIGLASLGLCRLRRYRHSVPETS